MNRISRLLSPGFLLVFLLLFGGCNSSSEENPPPGFSGDQALIYAAKQLDFGPRIPGSPGHEEFQEWAKEELEISGWRVSFQEFSYFGEELSNIVATKSALSTASKSIIIAAHYDTRPYSDADPDLTKQVLPVPGANDGASGTAILLELARVLPDYYQLDVQLVFFDGEDSGGIDGWNWIAGSTHFAQNLEKIPSAVVVVDMIGDSDQTIYLEKNSNPFLAAEIWDIAKEQGNNSFIFQEKYSMLDDHSPFVALGIPAVLIIDFDYPHWHTSDDTLDKISAKSLQNVGGVLLEWLNRLEERGS